MGCASSREEGAQGGWFQDSGRKSSNRWAEPSPTYHPSSMSKGQPVPYSQQQYKPPRQQSHRHLQQQSSHKQTAGQRSQSLPRHKSDFDEQGSMSSASSFASQRQHSHTDHADTETDSEWDRYTQDSEDEDDSLRGNTVVRPSYDVNERRNRERSLFGLTDKRAPTPLKETTSLKLAKLRGCTFVNQYVVIKYLGRGACGRVFLCMDMTDNRLYAVKIVKKGELEAQRGGRQAGAGQRKKRNPIEDLKREVAIMRTLRHKNITALQEVVDDPSGNKMLLVMDYMEGGPVMTREALERGRCIPEPLALQYFRDMCKALDYLHYHKVVHGDLKPENVLMSARGNVTLSDFGCSKVIMSGNEYLERCNGTPAFLAPEMMRPHSRYRGRPTDVYALGACLYTFVFGRIPFNAPNVFKLFQVVQHEPLRFPESPAVSPELKDLLQRMLCKDPAARLTMPRVMKHSWVTRSTQWPLRTVREMIRAGDTLGDDDAPEMPDFMSTLNVLDIPRQDHLAEMLRPGLTVRTYQDGECLIRQGEQSTHLFYIDKGQVEVLLRLPPSRDTASSTQTGRSDEGRSQDLIGNELPPSLLAGASKAKESTRTLSQGPREFLVAMRSEGQFVGEMASFATAALRCATVRAKGPVRVRLVPGVLLSDCVERIPEARQQAKEMVWMKQSENMVLEAMAHLSAVHDVLEEMLLGPQSPEARPHLSDLPRRDSDALQGVPTAMQGVPAAPTMAVPGLSPSQAARSSSLYSPNS